MAEKDTDQSEARAKSTDFPSKKINTKFIVCLTGMPGSGKSTVADSLNKKGFAVIAMGDVVRDEGKRKNIEPNDMNLGNLMLNLRKQFGPGAIAQLILNELEKRENRGDSTHKIVIDGVRSVPEVELLQTIGRVRLLAIHASASIRLEHLRKRARGDAPFNEYEFDNRDKRELAVGISEAIAMSDEMLSNNNLTIEELTEKAVEIVQKWVREFCSDDIRHPTIKAKQE
ncbi:MAG: AAA family ATPase [Candidatus Nitrosopolaris sp.]|jgi:dephospho-CoA kinase